jgi:hypothetical protein
MASPLQLIQTLLTGLGQNNPKRKALTMRPRYVGSPTADRLLSSMRNAPIEQTDYDPDSVSPELRETQPEPWNQTRVRQINQPDRLTKLQEEADYLAGDENRGRGGSIIEKPGRLKSGLLLALQGIGESARRNVEAGRTDWADLAGVAGAGAGGLGVGVADPKIIVRARHKQAVAENEKDLNSELNRRNAISIIDSRKANDAYKGSLEEKALRDQELREKDINRKQKYQDASLKIRQDALDGRISYQTWQKQQKELDRAFNEDKFDETQRHNKATEGISQQNADSSRINALKPPAGTGDPNDALDRAQELQRQIDELDTQDKKESSYKPVLDKDTKEPMTNAKGQIVYSNDFTDAYKQRQQQKKVLAQEKERLFGEARKAKGRSAANSNTTFSVSAWKAKNPNGDASQAEAKARSLGYTVIN